MNTQPPSSVPTEDQLRNLVQCLQSGLTRRLAANYISISEAELQRWITANPALEIRLGKAEADFQLRCIDAIMSARDKKGNLNVRAVMFLLEARFPEQFGRKSAARKSGTSSNSKLIAAAVTASSASTPQSERAPISPEPPIHIPEVAVASALEDTTAAVSNITAFPEPSPAPLSSKPAAHATAIPCAPVRSAKEPGRNEPCPCASGHKYKHCCGAKNERMRRTGLQNTLRAAA
jgi:hypothetical protein